MPGFDITPPDPAQASQDWQQTLSRTAILKTQAEAAQVNLGELKQKIADTDAFHAKMAKLSGVGDPERRVESMIDLAINSGQDGRAQQLMQLQSLMLNRRSQDEARQARIEELQTRASIERTKLAAQIYSGVTDQQSLEMANALYKETFGQDSRLAGKPYSKQLIDFATGSLVRRLPQVEQELYQKRIDKLTQDSERAKRVLALRERAVAVSEERARIYRTAVEKVGGAKARPAGEEIRVSIDAVKELYRDLPAAKRESVGREVAEIAKALQLAGDKRTFKELARQVLSSNPDLVQVKPGALPSGQSYPAWITKPLSVNDTHGNAKTPDKPNAKTPDQFADLKPYSPGEAALGGLGAAGMATGKALLSLIDMGAGTLTHGIPRFLTEHIARSVFSTKGALTGEDLSEKQVHVAAKLFADDYWNNPHLQAPVNSAVQWALESLGMPKLPTDPDAVDRVMERVSHLISLGAEKAEARTEGKITKENFEALVDFGMQYLGQKPFAMAGAKAFDRAGAPKGKSAGGEQQMAEDMLAKMREGSGKTEAAPPPATPREPSRGYANLSGDEVLNAEQQAYNLMAEGASKAKVEAAIKRNPQLAAAMERIRQRRGDVKDSRLGIVIQGEVLDPLAPEVKLSESRAVATAGAPEVPRPTIDNEVLQKLGHSSREAGKADPKVLAALGAVGLVTNAVLAQAFPAVSDDVATAMGGGGMTLAAILGAGKATPLGALLDRSAYTLKTLERLQPSAHTFTREQITQQLNRQDVGKAEKEIFQRVLGDKETITAQELMAGIKEATGDFELKGMETKKFADYGLPAIDRKDAVSNLFEEAVPPESFEGASATAVNPQVGHWEVYSRDGRFLGDFADSNVRTAEEAIARVSAKNAELSAPPPKPRTTVYQSPVELGTANHFQDPNYFAHARSFDEGGVRHVVELQSDLAQKAGKPLSAEERVQRERSIEDAQKTLEILQKSPVKRLHTSDPLWLDNALQHFDSFPETAKRLIIQVASQNLGFLNAALRDADGSLHYDRAERVLRDAMAATDSVTRARARNVFNAAKDYVADQLEVKIAEAQAKLTEVTGADLVRPMLKDWWKRIIREEMAEAAKPQEGVAANSVRFATADTVAKVEGWPDEQAAWDRAAGSGSSDRSVPYPRPEQRFQPEHQSIYDRYKGDIERWLRNEFKAREYTDQHGHTWLEVDLNKGKGGNRVQMFGGADQKLLAAIAAGGVGALVASKLVTQDKLEAALDGGLAGAALTLFPEYLKYIKRDWKAGMKDTLGVGVVVGGGAALDRQHPAEGALIGMLYGTTKVWPKSKIPMLGNLNIDDTINLARGGIAVREHEVANVARAMRVLVPNEARWPEVTRALEKGDLSGLSRQERAAANAYRDLMDSWGEAAKDAGVIDDVIENYVTHVVERLGESELTLSHALRELFGVGTSGLPGGSSRFAQRRKYATFDELQKALSDTGLAVKTMNLPEIMEIYGKSMARAIENKRMFNAFAAAKEGADGGTALIAEAKDAPRNYVTINHPQLRNMKVHPDLAEPLKFVLGGRSDNLLVRGALTASMAQKRVAVLGSFFHAMNLGVAHIGAQGFRGVGDLLAEVKRIYKKDYTPPIAEALRVLHYGGLSESTKALLKGGLQLEALSDVDKMALTKVGEAADNAVNRVLGFRPGAKAVLGFAEKMQQKLFDKVTWDYLHTGLKTLSAHRLYEEALRKHPTVPPEKLAEQVASHVNKTYGGLDWYRMATEMETAWGRNWAFGTYSPQGRAALQVAMFAPDWTISTFKAFSDALPGSTRNPLTQQLALKYVLRTGVLYATALNGLNMMFSGHPIWENEDPLMIDLGDGRKMQMAKHAMEGPEWFQNPGKTMYNKLGWLPKEFVLQLTGREYISQKGAPPMESRTEHLLKNFKPIGLGGAVSSERDLADTLPAAAAGAVGIGIYGKTEEERDRDREARREKRRQKKEQSE